MSIESDQRNSKPDFTVKQGQYLAFIYWYTKLNRQPPAEKDIQRYFGVTPPTAHQMVVTLTKKGLITRQPGKARSIQLNVARKHLPDLV